MNKYDFLRQLEEQLEGFVSSQEIAESVQYYREYIEEEIRLGKTEEEVLASLGSANSIANSIIDARGNDSDSNVVYEEEIRSHEDRSSSAKVFHAEGWQSTAILIGIIVVIILLLVFAFKLVAALLQFLIPFSIVIFVIKLVTERK